MTASHRLRSRAFRATAAGCIAIGLLGAGSASAARTSGGQSCHGVTHIGRWDQIAMPSFPNAPQDMADRSGRASTTWNAVPAAVDRANPNRLFASDGNVVMRSTDGGCSWQPVFSLYPDGIPTDGSTELQPWIDPTYVIRDIDVAGTGAVPHVYLALTNFVGVGSPEPDYLAASDDGGSHWSVHPVVGGTGATSRLTSAANSYDGVDVFASQNTPSTVYLGTVFYGGVPDGSSRTYTLLVSHDAGATWKVVSATALWNGDMSEFVDPRDAKTVWRGYDLDGGSNPELVALKSTNSGAAFHAVLAGAPPGPQVYDPPYVAGIRDGAHTCLVARSAAAVFLSAEDGGSWHGLAALPPLDARSGPAYVEGASCARHGQVVALAGYQPQRYKAPPFTRSALWAHTGGGAWRLLAPLPRVLADGSLTIAGPTSHPVAFWFGLKTTDTFGSTTPSDCIWLRLRL